MTKPVILTGLRSNNALHIGNYFGALKPTVEMASKNADQYQINLFLPDLHSFTTPIDHGSLYQSTFDTAKLYLAAGLPADQPDILIYRQSFVPAHSELTWILSCFTGFGEMSRMTQFKDKSQKAGNDQVTAGLFSYPILMAADILLYRARYVPVGDDQTQHLEFTRDIAMRMNNRFGDLFTVPVNAADQHKFFGTNSALRIRDLVDPTRKMSKSDDSGRGVVFLTDSPEAAHKKVMSATTDSLAHVNYDRQNQPGITNLIDILAALRGQAAEHVSEEYRGLGRYGDFKRIVADELAAFLDHFQSKLSEIDDHIVNQLLGRGEATASSQAEQTLVKVQRAVGLRS